MNAFEAYQARRPAHLETVAALAFTVEASATAQLRAEKPSTWKARFHQSDLSAAIRCAARLARKEEGPILVIASNRWGAFAWEVALPGSDTFSGSIALAKPGQARAYVVTADAEVRRIAWA